MVVWGLVLAAGSGERFGGRKQFATVGGVRAVDRAVRLVRETCDGVVLVLPIGHAWDGDAVDVVVPGGATRSASVRAGLGAVPMAVDVVLVHDAAHPLASSRLVDSVLRAVEAGADGAVPGLPLSEAPVQVDGDRVVGHPSRRGLVLEQVPYALRAEVLRRVHADDCEAVEDVEPACAAGATVVVVPGDPWNVHVTTEAELRMADALASALGSRHVAP